MYKINNKNFGSYSLSLLKFRMTFILGSRCKDGVVLVADRKITIDGGGDYDECDKLFGDIRHIVYGSSGVTTMFELFRGYTMNYINTHPGEITYQMRGE